MADLSPIANVPPAVLLLMLAGYGGGRFLPARPLLLRTVRATLMAATLIALSVRTFVYLAPDAAKSLNPAGIWWNSRPWRSWSARRPAPGSSTAASARSQDS
ncbi:MAG: hypothetical protein WDN45_10500 [Caulobacteraceae bacterium]